MPRLDIPPALKGFGLEQLTTWPTVEQPQLPDEKLVGAEVLAGNVVEKLNGPEAVAVPMLLTLTGNVAVCPTARAGTGPTLTTTSGAKQAVAPP